MAIEVETKDCTALSDAELEEMADLCAGGPAQIDIGVLSKQREEWVLITRARAEGELAGFSFCTLERIGGTPAVLVGCASVARVPRRDLALKGVMTDQLYRAVLAFPDEDVLVATRLIHPTGFEAFAVLHDVVPRPGHKPTGEERAWGRRLVKRFGVGGDYDDRAFVIRGGGDLPCCVLDYQGEGDAPAEVAALFDQVNPAEGGALVAFGWALAEELAELEQRR